ncbi:MAG TPA: type 4a pilus biogenesis protein PilO [Gammaproteobacteria bacterium]|nr:type 4a pilus biogenesis protein PilO [Gammaproteobacteria bacterium]HET7587760.1 type 4a pilus biogenesis protein PilO [Gammaproteobacteria bacterium]
MAMNLDLNFDLQAINDLDFREAGNWPIAGKAALIALIFAVIVGAGYWFTIRDKIDQLHTARQQETTLKDQFKGKAHKAANLDALRKQLAEMQASFGTLLRQLPSQTEVDSLLRDISQTAQVDGLEQKLFQPQGENKKDFYAEKPIHMIVTGGFHDLAKFVSDVAALPRIVTLHDISIKPVGKNGTGELSMSLTAKIYRYLEQDGGKK